jgi:hypothetical protein
VKNAMRLQPPEIQLQKEVIGERLTELTGAIVAPIQVEIPTHQLASD